MLKFEDHQVGALSIERRANFVERLLDRLSRSFDVTPANRPNLRKAAHRAVEVAHGFDLRSERAVGVYVTVALLAGPGIKDDPLVRRKLSSVMADQDAKARFLMEWLTALEDALSPAAEGSNA